MSDSENTVSKDIGDDIKEEIKSGDTRSRAERAAQSAAKIEKKAPKKTRSGKKSKKSHMPAIIAGCAAGIIAVAAIGYGAYVNAYDKIMPHTYIDNVEVGGMTQTDAAEALSSAYSQDKIADKTINFHCMDSSSTININNLSMVFEPEKMASDAYNAGREEPGFISKLKNFTVDLFSKTELTPAVSYDEQALTGAISDLCSPYEKDPLGYTYRLGDGDNIIIAKPQQGVKVDMNAAVSSVLDQICTFNFGDVTFEPLITDAEPLDLDAFYNYITSPAVNASYAKDENNKVYVVPSKPQIVVSKAEIEKAVNQSEIEYSVPVQLVQPAADTAFLQSIMYEDTLGTYTTSYGGSSASRSNNISLSSNTISGLELLPGERFDFNKVVGERTPGRGYLPAPVYVVKGGETVSETDYGGGICQVSSTIYCAVNRAGLDVIERTSHSKDVTYVPKGMDATVSWGGPEFIFENSTEYPIRIFVSAGGGTLSVSIVGSRVSLPDEKIDVVNDGNNIVATKTVTDDEGNTTQEVFDSANPPLPPPTEALQTAADAGSAETYAAADAETEAADGSESDVSDEQTE